jgi:hypothetical protein
LNAAATSNTSDGVRNSGFETLNGLNADPSVVGNGWTSIGSVRREQAVRLCTPVERDGRPVGLNIPCPDPATGSTLSGEIKPAEGNWMALISTEETSVGEVGAGITQEFRIPAGVSHLRFNYIYLSEEFHEWTPRKTLGLRRLGVIPYGCGGREGGDGGAARVLRYG